VDEEIDELIVLLRSFKLRQDDLLLPCAIKFGTKLIPRLLIEKGENINKSFILETPLVVAAENGHEEIVKLLLKNEANIEAESDFGRTSLVTAAKYGHETVARLLLRKGANVEARNNVGLTPLAVLNGYEMVVRLLLQNGANTKVKDNDGWTPLALAKVRKHEAVVKLLSNENGRSEV
jgi:ankyrin repeat protein